MHIHTHTHIHTYTHTEIISEYGQHLGVQGEFNKLQFREMMRGELFRYAKRHLANVLKENEKDQKFHQTILMLKMIETNISTQIKDLKNVNERQLLTQAADATAGGDAARGFGVNSRNNGHGGSSEDEGRTMQDYNLAFLYDPGNSDDTCAFPPRLEALELTSHAGHSMAQTVETLKEAFGDGNFIQRHTVDGIVIVYDPTRDIDQLSDIKSSLEFTKKMCIKKEHVKYTKYFGSGTFFFIICSYLFCIEYINKMY